MAAIGTAGATGPKEEHGKRRSPQERFDERLGGVDLRVSINPIRPPTGIQTGLVVAYGHVIRPPFQVEYEGQQLTINGVSVEPSIIEERRRQKIAALTAPDVAKAKGMDDLEDKIKEMIKSGRSRDDVLKHVRAQTHIVELARWEGERAMLIKRLGGTYHVIGGFKLGDPRGSTPHEKGPPSEAEVKQARLREVRSILEKGACLVFLSSGGTLQTRDIRKEVLAIMRDKSLDKERQFERLRESVFDGLDTPASDIQANFVESEWPSSD